MTPFNRILCPVDFSEHSRAALKHAADLARDLGSELILIHVVEPILYPVEYGMAPVPSEDLESQAAHNAEAELQKLVSQLAEGVSQTQTRVEFGRAEDCIVRFAELQGVGLVVLATHGLTGLKHMLLGSTAERIVRSASCPVLTIKVHR